MSSIRPSGDARRRIWIAAASVSGIVVATTAVGAVVLSEDGAERVRRSPAGSSTQAAVKARSTLPDVKWELSWHDEFNGRGRPSKHWSSVRGGGTNGWSHRALQYYTAGSALQDGEGNLVITARKAGASSTARCWYGRCKYFSGRIQTEGKFHQTYGRFAVRAKLPTGKGIWPAFWMQRETSPYGEIDVVETVGSKPNLVQGYAHAQRRMGGGQRKLAQSLSAGYHVFGVDWTPDRIVWWVDGHAYAQLKAYRGWPFDKPFFLILNVQVGGEWPGAPNARTPFPARMAVDWVRVYRG